VFLTAEELVQLTGRNRSDCQRRWLERNGWAHTVNLNGRPVVSRAYAEKRLGGGPAVIGQATIVTPNFDALRRTG
jgi:hypothetical protein